jgi:uncharacterized membrane protein
VVSSFVLWPCIAGSAFLIAGPVSVRKELADAPGLDKLIALGPVFVAAPLAVFAAEHLVGARFIVQVIPPWIPAPLLFTYFVGVALLAAALSLTFKKYVRLSAPLLALMFFLFVLLIHIPGVVAHINSRLFWTIMLRDLTFAAGALALTATSRQQESTQSSAALTSIARIIIAVALVFFGVEHWMHPQFAPGVPLAKLTPAWVPLPFVLAYLIGAVLLIAGLALLLKMRSRIAATSVGLVMTLLTLFLYLPILAMASGTAQLNEGLNYVADTLLFGGAILLLAAAMPGDNQPAN